MQDLEASALPELDDILRTQGSVKELEFEMDGLQKKLFEIDAKMKPLMTMRKSVQQAQEQLQRYAQLESLPSETASFTFRTKLQSATPL